MVYPFRGYQSTSRELKNTIEVNTNVKFFELNINIGEASVEPKFVLCFQLQNLPGKTKGSVAQIDQLVDVDETRACNI